jgi:hypothetical protein
MKRPARERLWRQQAASRPREHRLHRRMQLRMRQRQRRRLASSAPLACPCGRRRCTAQHRNPSRGLPNSDNRRILINFASWRSSRLDAALSRTDKTKPFWVKLAHGDLAVIELHDHRAGSCDLPAHIDRRWGRKTRGCRYEFHYTGTRVCCCPMCHSTNYPDRSEQQRRRRERRQQRRIQVGD